MRASAVWTAVVLGALAGVAAGVWQLAVLSWGALGSDQAWMFWGAFVGAGAVATLVLAGLVSRLTHLASPIAVVAGLVVTGVGFAFLVPRNVRELPHVFLVVTDTTRADHVSVYGYERDTTPWLRELGGRSVVFNESLSQGSHTIVSTPSLLASCYPSEHGLDDYSDVLASDHELLSEVLTDAGWYSFGIVTNPHLSERNGFDQGWASYELFGQGHHSAVYADTVNARVLYKLDIHRPAWIGADEARGTAPVFGFFFYTDPHAPYQSPRQYRDRWLPEDADSSAWVFVWSKDSTQAATAPWVKDLVAQYDATLSYWDESFERLSGELHARGLWDNALVIYTSDHGEEFFDHDAYGHGHALFEEVVRVPLIVSFPVPLRFPPLRRTTRTTDVLVSSVDVLPTILEYLRLPVPETARGTSVLGPALGGRDDTARVVFLEEILSTYQRYDLRGVRTERWKFVISHEQNGDPAGEISLFDLVADPDELENLAEEEPEELERLQDLLVEHGERTAQSVAQPGTMEPDEQHLDRLRALGYIH